MDASSELASSLLSHRTRNADAGRAFESLRGALHAVLEAQLRRGLSAQQVYDDHELLVLHWRRCCHYRAPVTRRCAVYEPCAT